MIPPFPLLGAAEFAADAYRPEWLVKGCLVRHEPAVFAGPSKSLKTSLLVDLAVSLASATPFLGRFEVPAARSVVVLSGESGRPTLAETARRVAHARNIRLEDLEGRFHVGLSLPTLSDPASMALLADAVVRAGGAEVVIIDPLYLCLGDVDAKNLFAVGAALRTATEALARCNSMLILAHHANKGLLAGKPMELRHLSHTGLEQLARQFCLLNRRSAYKQDGRHLIWMRLGGSAGHGGLWAVRVEEGVNAEEFGRREWHVHVETAERAEADELVDGDRLRDEKAGRRLLANRHTILGAVDAAVAAGDAAATLNAIRMAAPASPSTASATSSKRWSRPATWPASRSSRRSARGRSAGSSATAAATAPAGPNTSGTSDFRRSTCFAASTERSCGHAVNPSVAVTACTA